MATSFEVRRAVAEDAEKLARVMCSEDIAEVWASDGFGPVTSVRSSMESSRVALTALVDGKVAAIAGAGPLDPLGGVASVWLLTGEAIRRYPHSFFHAYRTFVKAMLREWSTLIAWIDARNTRALRVASLVGFQLCEPEPHGVAGLPFRMAIIRRA